MDEGVIAGRFKKIDDYSIWSLDFHFSKNPKIWTEQLEWNRTFLGLSEDFCDSIHPLFEKDWAYYFEYRQKCFVTAISNYNMSIVQIESQESMKLVEARTFNFDDGNRTEFVKSFCFSDYSLQLCIIDRDFKVYRYELAGFIDEFILGISVDGETTSDSV